MNKFIFLLPVFISSLSIAQSISSRSNEVALDYSDAKRSYNTSLPKITWISPEGERVFLKEGKVMMNIAVKSKTPLKSVTLTIRDKNSGTVKGSTSLQIADEKKLTLNAQRNIVLPDGVNEVEVVAENQDGMKSVSKREIHVGATALADAAKLGRKDYALVFVTDTYDNWKALVNPIFDGRTIAENLQKTYGFATEIVENPTQSQILNKLREYAEKKYSSLDQLFILFAGHGFYDETFKEGFVVTRESLPDDPGRSSYLRHSTLRSTINNSPCQHILLVMDVCFGGTFDENVASRGADDDTYQASTQSEIIMRKLQFKTRKYLTSGGKEYVSDGIAGRHSPFAKQFIDALEKGMGSDGVLTINKLMTYVEKLKTAPQFGKFGSDQQGSEFVFVVKSN